MRRGFRRTGVTAFAAGALTLGMLLGGCHSGRNPQSRVVTGGSVDQGERAIKRFGCGSCHTIPGIAGELRNTPDNLTHWISAPKSVEPGTDMPDLGVSQDQARNITASLYTLR